MSTKQKYAIIALYPNYYKKISSPHNYKKINLFTKYKNGKPKAKFIIKWIENNSRTWKCKGLWKQVCKRFHKSNEGQDQGLELKRIS